MPLDDTSFAGTVIRQALDNMADAVEGAAATIPGHDPVRLTGDMRDAMFCLIAYLITVDGQYDPRERALVAQLIPLGSRSNAELEFLRVGTERWRRLEREVPEYFRVAVEADRRNGTDYARSLMREIQLLANNCCVTDERFAAEEKRAIHRYLQVLEAHLERETGSDQAWLEP